jgi:hypothetical protein
LSFIEDGSQINNLKKLIKRRTMSTHSKHMEKITQVKTKNNKIENRKTIQKNFKNKNSSEMEFNMQVAHE